MELLNIGLSSWIIQDGNYGDFAAGDDCRFALEVGMSSFAAPQDVEPQLQCIQGAAHRMDGTVVLVTPEFTILDVGLLAYRDGKPHDKLVDGAHFRGRAYIGIDPFFWSETHAHRAGVPNLFYRWHIHEILLETTPWTTKRSLLGGEVRTRRTEAASFRAVPMTDAWNDDGGHAHYILRAECLGTA